MSIEAYPLQWPMGWKRTEHPTRARFSVTPNAAIVHLFNELQRLGASGTVINSNVPIRRDGLPYSSVKAPDDAGVVAYFKLNGEEQCIPCDKWDRVHDNMHAIGLTVQALRGLERWGAKDMVAAAFRGFKALPAAGETGGEAIPMPPDYFDGCKTKEEVKNQYRALAQTLHPDMGGSTDEFAELNRQYTRRMKEA